MPCAALATDYDGTIARDGAADGTTPAALRRTLALLGLDPDHRGYPPPVATAPRRTSAPATHRV